MIRFLTELLIHRTWFGHFEEFTCSQLACSEMQASARTCGRRATDNMIKNVIKSRQYILIIPHGVIQVTTISFWVSETRLRLPQVIK